MRSPYLNRLVTRNVAKLKPDRVAYCVWCNDAGHLLDDGTVFRLGESEYRLCTAERQIDWLLDSAIGFDVEISEVTETNRRARRAGADLLRGAEGRGPRRGRATEALRDRPFSRSAGRPLTVSRTGFTGDLGYELWMDPERGGGHLGCA